MASVSNVSLSIVNGPTPSTKNVTVSGTMTFDASEAGKAFHLEIKLRGEDLPGDKLPAADAVNDDDLYTFQWGNSWPLKSYKHIAAASPGSHPFSEVRAISTTILDEDAGKIQVGQDPNTGAPLLMPCKDEIYAKVTLSGAPVSSRSPTATLGAGV